MAVAELVSSGLIEKDIHGDVLWVWSYPAISREQRELFIEKCGLCNDSKPLQPFVWSQFQKLWHYIFTVTTESSVLPKVTHVSLVLVTRDFNPEKYESFASILTKMYTRTGSPASMLENYLSVITKGRCNNEDNGMFVAEEYETRQAYAAASVRDVIAKFGIEAILVVTGMLLKKKIVLYHSDIEELLTISRSLPAFVWHRQDWSMLYPYALYDGPELNEIKSLTHVVAGFIDASIENRSDFYDLFVNLSTNEIVVSTQAKEAFSMGKLHKDLATYIVQCAEDETKSNQLIIKEIAVKIKELLNNLKGLSKSSDEFGQPVITLEDLRERNMAPATENFLFNLAAAEGLLKTS